MLRDYIRSARRCIQLTLSAAPVDCLTIYLPCRSGDGGAASKGFGKVTKPEGSAVVKAAGKVAASDSKWELTAYAVDEWLAWIEQQKAVAGVKGDNVYVQIQLDGTVRASGTGSPPWQKFLDDIPPLDDVRTKFTDGIGRT